MSSQQTNTDWTAQRAAVHKALIRAQARCRNVVFDARNPHFKSQYASLAAVRDAILPHFHAEGLAVVQSLYTSEKRPEVVTRVVHENGDWMELSRLCLPPVKQDPQGWASSITYARRYSLLALAGVTGDYDDDGNEASSPEKTQKK